MQHKKKNSEKVSEKIKQTGGGVTKIRRRGAHIGLYAPQPTPPPGIYAKRGHLPPRHILAQSGPTDNLRN